MHDSIHNSHQPQQKLGLHKSCRIKLSQVCNLKTPWTSFWSVRRHGCWKRAWRRLVGCRHSVWHHGDSNSVGHFPNCDHTWAAADTDTAYEWCLVEVRYSALSPGRVRGQQQRWWISELRWLMNCCRYWYSIRMASSRRPLQHTVTWPVVRGQ